MGLHSPLTGHDPQDRLSLAGVIGPERPCLDISTTHRYVWYPESGHVIGSF